MSSVARCRIATESAESDSRTPRVVTIDPLRGSGVRAEMWLGVEDSEQVLQLQLDRPWRCSKMSETRSLHSIPEVQMSGPECRLLTKEVAFDESQPRAATARAGR